MRYRPGGPEGLMDYLLVQLMRWAREEGFQWFNLGLTPLAGNEERRSGRLWDQFSALIYRHGEAFYPFQGLRHYKEKFGPVWEPKYLASPGGLALPRVLANLTSLISGGLAGAVRKDPAPRPGPAGPRNG
jgi:phosphatidylglycerol lysyltransferase